MLKNLIRKFNQNSPFTNEWGLQAGSNSHTDKRVIVGYTVTREAMALTVNVIKAKFTMKDNYFSIKQRGYIAAEFIPYVESPQDSTRKIFAIKEKKTMILYSDYIYDYISNKPVQIEYRREREGEVHKLEILEKNSNWEWSLEISGNQTDLRKVLLRPSEHFYIQKLFSFSIPYIFGWYAIGDSRLAEQSLAAEPELKDPFENI